MNFYFVLNTVFLSGLSISTRWLAADHQIWNLPVVFFQTCLLRRNIQPPALKKGGGGFFPSRRKDCEGACFRWVWDEARGAGFINSQCCQSLFWSTSTGLHACLFSFPSTGYRSPFITILPLPSSSAPRVFEFRRFLQASLGFLHHFW